MEEPTKETIEKARGVLDQYMAAEEAFLDALLEDPMASVQVVDLLRVMPQLKALATAAEGFWAVCTDEERGRKDTFIKEALAENSHFTPVEFIDGIREQMMLLLLTTPLPADRIPMESIWYILLRDKMQEHLNGPVQG